MTFSPIGAAGPASASVVYNGAGSTFQIGLIGDSAWAGIRWLGTWGPLQRFNFRADLESCRRTVTASCRGREGYAPPNTVSALRSQAGSWGAVLVVATGYNDPGGSFAAGVDAVMQEAMRQQIYRVVWMTMRTANVSYVSPTYSSNNVTFRQNNAVLRQKAVQYGGRLMVADWDTYSAGHPEWFTADGIHLRPAGGYAATQFIADSASRALAGVTQPSIVDPTRWIDVRPGQWGQRVVIVQQFLARAGVSVLGGNDGHYGSNTTAAVMEFQRRVGLRVSGVVDKATAVELGLWYRDASTPKPVAPPGWIEIVAGDRGLRVAILHSYLRQAGVAVAGDFDGIFRWPTLSAVRSFQLSRGLRATGNVDQSTAQALGLWWANSPLPPPAEVDPGWVDVAPGDSGFRVAIVHSYLRSRGIAVYGDYDGVYGGETIDAVRLFQASRGLRVTGVVDLTTARELGLWPRAAAPTTAQVLAASSSVTMATAGAAAPAVGTSSSTTSTTTVTTSSTTTSMPPAPAPAGQLGDLVWLDADGDGIQDPGEAGIDGIEVRLRAPSGELIAQTIANRDGQYTFDGLAGGDYVVEVVVPAEMELTEHDRGAGARQDEFDSDADPREVIVSADETVVRIAVTIAELDARLTVDIGLVVAPAPPVDTTTSTPTSTAAPATTSTTTTSSTTTTTTTSSTTSTSLAPPSSEPPTTVAATTQTSTPPATAAPTTSA
jgi:peptidoglycan hydrolase-like protein with peptidoglycan-binding domain